jgi:hypothetical protein
MRQQLKLQDGIQQAHLPMFPFKCKKACSDKTKGVEETMGCSVKQIADWLKRSTCLLSR